MIKHKNKIYIGSQGYNGEFSQKIPGIKRLNLNKIQTNKEDLQTVERILFYMQQEEKF